MCVHVVTVVVVVVAVGGNGISTTLGMGGFITGRENPNPPFVSTDPNASSLSLLPNLFMGSL